MENSIYYQKFMEEWKLRNENTIMVCDGVISVKESVSEFWKFFSFFLYFRQWEQFVIKNTNQKINFKKKKKQKKKKVVVLRNISKYSCLCYDINYVWEKLCEILPISALIYTWNQAFKLVKHPKNIEYQFNQTNIFLIKLYTGLHFLLGFFLFLFFALLPFFAHKPCIFFTKKKSIFVGK